MRLKLVPVLILSLAKFAMLEELEVTTSRELKFVSTNRRSFPSQQVEEGSTELKKKLPTSTELPNTSHRLDDLEQQNKQIRETLETLKSALTNFTDLHNEVAKNGQKLEEIVLQNQQFQMKLHNIVSALKTIPNPFQFQTNNKYPRNCKEVQERGGNVSKIYHIKPYRSPEPFAVFCDMETRGGGWTYFMNRFDGSQDFYLGWKDYKKGFGNLSGEFWLGLEHLYQLTADDDTQLLVEVNDWNNKSVYSLYNTFSIGNEKDGYYLKTADGYSGDGGDSFSIHHGMKFSTKDRDNDRFSGNCAQLYEGAWWYNACFHSQLTAKGIIWYTDLRSEAKMMLKPRDRTSTLFL